MPIRISPEEDALRHSSTWLRTLAVLALAPVLAGAAPCGRAAADDSNKYVLTHDALDKMLGALSDLRARNLLVKICGDNMDADVANLEKQPKAKGIIKNRGLSSREFVLTYKATAQIRQAEQARDRWQRTLQDPNAAPQAKLDATQKLADSLKTNLFTPEQGELVRRHMSDVETLLSPPK